MDYNNQRKKCQYEICNIYENQQNECKNCHQIFCRWHYYPSNHKCSQKQKVNKTICPLCEQEIKNDLVKDENVIWDSHFQNNCLINQNELQLCDQQSCNQIIYPINSITCNDCKKTYCLKHKYSYSHECIIQDNKEESFEQQQKDYQEKQIFFRHQQSQIKNNHIQQQQQQNQNINNDRINIPRQNAYHVLNRTGGRFSMLRQLFKSQSNSNQVTAQQYNINQYLPRFMQFRISDEMWLTFFIILFILAGMIFKLNK